MSPEELSELYGKGSGNSSTPPSPAAASPQGPKPPAAKADSPAPKKQVAASEPTKKGPSIGTLCLAALIVSGIGIAVLYPFMKKSAGSPETARAVDVAKPTISSNGNATAAIAAAIDNTQTASNQAAASLQQSPQTAPTIAVSFNTNLSKAELVGAMGEALKKTETEKGPDLATEFPAGYTLFGLAGGKFFVSNSASSRPLTATWSEEKILVEEDYLHVWMPEIQIGNDEKFSLIRDIILPVRAGAASALKFDLASKTILTSADSPDKNENQKAPTHEIAVRILAVDENGIIAVIGLKAL